MNRIYNLVEDELSSAVFPPMVSDDRGGDDGGQREQAHCIFTPLHYERNYAYPLIVWLHGQDGNERQVTQIMPLVSMRNYVGVGPRGPRRTSVEHAYTWGSDTRHVAMAEERVVSAIAAARRWLNVAPNRIYLAGYGCGGTMALRIALQQPQAFAGVLSIGGAFPDTGRPLAQLEAVRHLRILLATARDSHDYPPSTVCRHLRLFHTAGMSVDLRQYPCGDELTTNMLADVDRWIMQQVVAPEPELEDQPSHRAGD